MDPWARSQLSNSNFLLLYSPSGEVPPYNDQFSSEFEAFLPCSCIHDDLVVDGFPGASFLSIRAFAQTLSLRKSAKKVPFRTNFSPRLVPPASPGVLQKCWSILGPGSPAPVTSVTATLGVDPGPLTASRFTHPYSFFFPRECPYTDLVSVLSPAQDFLRRFPPSSYCTSFLLNTMSSRAPSPLASLPLSPKTTRPDILNT